MSDLLFITADDCHLCEHGRRVLDSLGIVRRELASESDEATQLAARGIPLSFLPVLTDGTHVLAYGRLSANRLRHDFGL